MLTFNRKRGFIGFDVGPGLRDDDLSRLGALFTSPRPRGVMATVIPTVPTAGWWRYRNRFQIFPMPPEAPRPPQVFGGVHSLLLEVAYDGASHDELDEYRGAVATREINRLLSGLLRGTEDRVGHFVRMDWVVLPTKDADGLDHWQAHFAQLGYFLEGEHPAGPTASQRYRPICPRWGCARTTSTTRGAGSATATCSCCRTQSSRASTAIFASSAIHRMSC